jgi:hypothetical protein
MKKKSIFCQSFRFDNGRLEVSNSDSVLQYFLTAHLNTGSNCISKKVEDQPWIPKRGEMIEVNDGGSYWSQHEFIAHDKRASSPYIVLHESKTFMYYKHARQINPIQVEINELEARIKKLQDELQSK